MSDSVQSAGLFLCVVCALVCCADRNAAGDVVRSPSESQQPAVTATTTDAAQPNRPTQRADLKVATFNINFGNVDLRAIVETIRKSSADLVFLQETNRRSERFLRKHLSAEYPSTYFSNTNKKWAAGGFGLLSKEPIENAKVLPPAKGGLFSLSPIRIARAAGLADVFNALQAMEEVHKREVAQLLKHLEGPEPMLVGGDLNSISSHNAPRTLAELGFVDAVGATNTRPDDETTWRWPLRGREVNFRIDYVFHSPHFQATRTEVLRTPASDHDLVLTELNWLGNKPKRVVSP
jgi:endonuclease/exonuclease/phosphatase (EEP) superfamily protein YafD